MDGTLGFSGDVSPIRFGRYGFALLAGPEAFGTLDGDWQRLAGDAAVPAFYVDPRWHRAVAGRLLDGGTVCLRIDDGQTVIGILPLQLRRIRHKRVPMSVLSFPAHPHIELSDAAIGEGRADPALLDGAIAFLHRHSGLPWRMLWLRGFPARSNLAGLTGAAAVSGANAFFTTDFGLMDRIPGKFLRNVERLSRKADSECGKVRAEFVRAPEDLRRAFDVFLRLESSGWKSGHGTAMAQSPRLVGFYRELLDAFGAEGWAGVNLLFFGETPAAAQFCLRAGDTWSILKIGYEDRLRDYGPGNILLRVFLERAIADPLVREVNLVTCPAWAERWHAETRPVHELRVFRPSLSGRLARLAVGLAGRAATLLKHRARKEPPR